MITFSSSYEPITFYSQGYWTVCGGGMHLRRFSFQPKTRAGDFTD